MKLGIKRQKKEMNIGPYTINLGRTTIKTPSKTKVTKTREIKKNKR